MSKDAKLKALEALENKEVDKISKADTLTMKTTWFDIDKKLFGYGGRFYKDSYNFQVLPISTDSMKVYSAMDENNELSVLNAINHIISNHMRVLDGTKLMDIDSILYEHDRFPALLLINRYTGGTNNISAEITCEAGHVNTENIRPEILNYNDISEKAEKLFDPKTGLFILKTKNSGTLKYRALTNGESKNVMEWITRKTREGDDIEVTFSELVGFFMHDSKDVEEAYMKYLSSSGDKLTLSIMLDFCQNQARIRQSESLKIECKTCNRLNNTITNLKGVKDLFLIPDVDSEY